MSAWIRTAGLGLVAATAPFAPLVTAPAAGQATVAQMTTDTPEYCSHLVEMLHATARIRPLTREVAALSDEGAMMCDHGETRRGILRLRRAMRLLMGGDG